MGNWMSNKNRLSSYGVRVGPLIRAENRSWRRTQGTKISKPEIITRKIMAENNYSKNVSRL